MGGRKAAVIGFYSSRRHGARRRGQQEIEKPKWNFLFSQQPLSSERYLNCFFFSEGQDENRGRERSVKRSEMEL